MRGATVVIVVVVACLGVLAEAGGAGAPRDRVEGASHCERGEVPRNGRCVRSRKCRRPGLRSMARSTTGRLLATESGEATYYGCLFSRDRMVEVRVLDEPYESCVHTCETMHSPRVAGAFAAMIYSWSFSYGAGVPDDGGSSVEVYSLRSGRTIRTYPVGGARVFLLADNGHTVTLEAGELRLHRRNGDDAVLDSGDISPASVRLDGRTLRWSNAGQAREASI